jgi:hypothetical protein
MDDGPEGCYRDVSWILSQGKNNGRGDRIYSGHPVLRPAGQLRQKAKLFKFSPGEFVNLITVPTPFLTFKIKKGL